LQATLRWSATRIVSYLTDLGLIGGPGRLLWTRSGLLQPEKVLSD